MRVKRLDVFGFKSFAKKTTIHFESGVTAIVGPNGSGKSNIVDAIRWVLGEHNPRDVRAPRLEDVIFNGTDTTAPLSMAEVRLTIANEQGLLPISFTEVAITRRVYRSGESECLINDSPCRLKDIQELLLGTGLGGGTYAIIEQGHIDMILSSKPEERRVVFEEASGVAKYLAKKQETVRRLDETEEHLVRIADIIGEVRRQVGALERAANKARQYKAQWEQLKQSELRLAVDEMSSGETRAKALEEQLSTLQATRDELDAKKNSFMISLEACNASVSATQEQLQALRTKVMECASGIEQHASQVSLKTRWIGEITQQVQSLEQEEQQLRQRLAQVEEQLAGVRGGSGELQTQVGAIQAQVAQGGGELATLEASIAAALSTVQEAKTQLFAAVSDASHQRNLVNDSTSKLHSLDAQLARYDEQQAQRAAKRDDIDRRHGASLHERATLQAQHEELTRRAAGAQQRLDAATGRRHESTGRVHQLQEQAAGQRAQVKLCEDLWQRYEGFPDTVKLLMSHSIDGLIGPLVDLVQALPGHEGIVEAALGPLSEALVVRDRIALARCREVLTAEQLDGCRFLVLSDCPSAPVAVERPVQQEGVAGAVKQYVRTTPAYQPMLDWLLNDSWVVDDIQRLLNDRFVPQSRLVSPREDRWDRRSWRLTGAASGSRSRLGRKQRWEQAQAGLQTLEQEAARVAAQANEAEQEWQRALGEQESVRGQLGQLTPNLQKLDVVIAQLAQEQQRLEEDARASELEAQESLARKEELRVALGQAQRTAADAETRQQALDRALADAQAARESSEQRRQELIVAKAQVETALQSLTDRLQALERRTQELESDRAHLAQQLEVKHRQRSEALARSSELIAQVSDHEQRGRQLTDDRILLESEVERVNGALREEEGRRDQVLPHLLAAEQQLSALARQIQEQSQQLSERTFRRARLVERLWELYQVDETAIQAELHAEISPLTDEQRTTMTEQVQKLRAKLEGIGPVSLGSVDEYDELKRRLEFLQTQQQDLTQARDDLKASITQINRTARAQFRETFERIRQEFQHYYARLFSGGEANLMLMDEEDVLECGIDIVARPPGKRLQSISLLSGGERALTAVALLFALFKVRPSPFCILDEIDAPLDEANVDRFTRVLEEFLALSQFILITHNKKTITKADSIYGVTMEEAGISKILSAKLTKSPAAPAPAIATGGPGPATPAPVAA